MIFSDNLIVDSLVFVIGALTLVYFTRKRDLPYWERKGFKALSGSFGSTKYLLQREAHADTIKRIYDAASEPFIGIYFPNPKLLLRDTELIRSILIKDFNYFTDRAFGLDVEREPLQGHLFGLPGAKWKKLRPKLTPTFTSGKLKAMFSTLIECGSTLQKYLENLANSNETLDVKEIASSNAINVIASVAFGIEVDTITDPNNEFRKCANTLKRTEIKDLIRRYLYFRTPKLAKLLGLTYDDPSIEKFIMSVLKEILEYREKNNISRKDFFQLLIQLRNTGSVHLDDDWSTSITTNESEKLMTFNEMAAQVFVFFTAGYETSSSTLTFCLYELAKNQKIQQRVQNEIDDVLAEHDGKITYESVSKMKFLENCVEVIEKGIEVIIPVFPLQRDDKYYDEPNTFKPERFSEENGAGKDQLTQPFLTFGDGPRNCIGLRLGKMQTKVGLVLMLQKFKYELEDQLKSKKLKFDPRSFLLSSDDTLKMKVFKR